MFLKSTDQRINNKKIKITQVMVGTSGLVDLYVQKSKFVRNTDKVGEKFQTKQCPAETMEPSFNKSGVCVSVYQSPPLLPWGMSMASTVKDNANNQEKYCVAQLQNNGTICLKGTSVLLDRTNSLVPKGKNSVLQTSLLCIVVELAGEGSVAVAVWLQLQMWMRIWLWLWVCSVSSSQILEWKLKTSVAAQLNRKSGYFDALKW